LVICRLLLEQEPERYERAAVRWLGRLPLERHGAGLRHAELAVAYLAAWADPARHDAATQGLAELGRVLALRRLGARLPVPAIAERDGYDRLRSYAQGRVRPLHPQGA
jgi:hypothetical protein